MNRNALVRAIVIGTVLQMAMILAGHFIPAVANLFAIGGMLISLAAGVLYAMSARGGWGDSLLGGAIAGGVCALVGIVASYALGDVEAILIVMGTAGSAVAGLAGGAIGKVVGR